MSNYSKDEELLEGLVKNDKTSIETIYRENYRLIQQLVVQNSGSEEDARDVFQEALIVLYQKVRSGDFVLQSQLRTYIYSVCRRMWLKRLQQKKIFDAPVEPHAERVDVEEDLIHHERLDQQYLVMKAALGKIGEPCKSLLEAFYIHNKNMQDISTYFGYTNADNAKNQKYKCLMRLKKLFFTQYKD